MLSSKTYRAGDSRAWDRVFLRRLGVEVVEVDVYEDGCDVTVYHYDSDLPVPFEELHGELRTVVGAAWEAWEASAEGRAVLEDAVVPEPTAALSAAR